MTLKPEALGHLRSAEPRRHGPHDRRRLKASDDADTPEPAPASKRRDDDGDRVARATDARRLLLQAREGAIERGSGQSVVPRIGDQVASARGRFQREFRALRQCDGRPHDATAGARLASRSNADLGVFADGRDEAQQGLPARDEPHHRLGARRGDLDLRPLAVTREIGDDVGEDRGREAPAWQRSADGRRRPRRISRTAASISERPTKARSTSAASARAASVGVTRLPTRIEQPQARRRLEIAHETAHRRLADRELGRRRGDGAGGHHGEEGLEAALAEHCAKP